MKQPIIILYEITTLLHSAKQCGPQKRKISKRIEVGIWENK